jgi:hypothetical protein
MMVSITKAMQEYPQWRRSLYLGNLKEWQTLSNLGAALPGTAIAIRSFSQPNQVIRLVHPILTACFCKTADKVAQSILPRPSKQSD